VPGRERQREPREVGVTGRRIREHRLATFVASDSAHSSFPSGAERAEQRISKQLLVVRFSSFSAANPRRRESGAEKIANEPCNAGRASSEMSARSTPTSESTIWLHTVRLVSF